MSGQAQSGCPVGMCPLCGTPAADGSARCGECGYDLAGVPPRPGAYARAALWWTVAGFLAIYAVIVVAVALAH